MSAETIEKNDLNETQHDDSIHVIPIPVMIIVWAGLIVLTILTISATQVELGKLNLWVALGIATVKASLVAFFFMHLKYEKPILGLIFFGTFLFLFLFIGLTLLDTTAYNPDLIPDYAPKINSQ